MNMRKTSLISRTRRIVAFDALTTLTGCSTNCTVPSFRIGPPPGGGGGGALTCAQNASQGIAVPLGSAATFAVLAAATVTNVGATVVSGDLGVSPGAAVTGFPPGIVINGTIHAADPVAAQAQLDVTKAFNNAAGRANPTAIRADIGGMTLAPGLYKAPVSLMITGNLTLDGKNDPNAVFIFQVSTTLTTSVNS